MIASKSIQILLAGVAAVAFAGTALAQGNPPNPAVKSAPVGAGQQQFKSSVVRAVLVPSHEIISLPAAGPALAFLLAVLAGPVLQGEDVGLTFVHDVKLGRVQ